MLKLFFLYLRAVFEEGFFAAALLFRFERPVIFNGSLNVLFLVLKLWIVEKRF